MTLEMKPESAARLEAAAKRLHFDVDELTVFLDSAAGDDRPAVPLTSIERALLAESGVSGEQLDAATAAIAAGAWERALTASELLLAEQSLSTSQAATALGVKDASVRRALMERRMWSFAVGGSHRIPTWQFQDDPVRADSPEEPIRTRLVEHLRDVVAAIPGGATAARVQSFMTTLTADLDPDRPPVTPVTWLRVGEDVGPVVSLLEDLVAA